MPKEQAIETPLAQAIEDAILFGKTADLETILDDIADDEGFPAELRNGLESLRYFREYYGPAAPLSGTDRKKVALMDSAWGMELLNMLRHRGEAAAVRRA